MRRDDHLFKTMSAAKVCIAECLKARAPFDSLAKYLDFLRSDPQWSAAEVAEVEVTARKAINAATSRSPSPPGCNWPPGSQTASPSARV
jgi:hypothetical protein